MNDYLHALHVRYAEQLTEDVAEWSRRLVSPDGLHIGQDPESDRVQVSATLAALIDHVSHLEARMRQVLDALDLDAEGESAPT